MCVRRRALSNATELVPGEPAGWVNWGCWRFVNATSILQRSGFEERSHWRLSSDSIEYLQGILESNRGNSPAAIPHLREAIRLNPKNLRATYLLALEIERQGDPDSEANFQQLIEQILKAQPNNMAALVELSRIGAKRGDSGALQAAIGRLSYLRDGWPTEALQQLDQLRISASGPGHQSSGNALHLSAQCVDEGSGVSVEPG